MNPALVGDEVLMHSMEGQYNPALVALSYAIATIASYAALSLAGRVAASGGRERAAWLVGGAAAMGLGIWAMHFVGMLAFSLSTPVAYDPLTVLASLIVAVLASGVALFTAGRSHLRLPRLLLSGLTMGFGVAAMHYMGMSAMRLGGSMGYNPPLVVLSVLIAVAASIVALWLAFRLRDGTAPGVSRLMAALVMGGAVVGMHYTGQSATRFSTHSAHEVASPIQGVDALGLAVQVAAGTLFVLLLALFAAFANERVKAQARRVEERIQQSRALEARVAERTAELEAERRHLERLAEQRRRLLEVARAILPSRSSGETISTVLGAVRELLDIDVATFLRFEPGARRLRPSGMIGAERMSPGDPAENWSADQGVIGDTLRSGRAELVNQAHLDPRSVYPDGVQVEIEHLISVPLTTKRGLLGVFYFNRLRNPPFREDEFELVQLFISYAAAAVEQRELTDQLAHQATHDSLTGLPNRALFEDRLEQAIHGAGRHGGSVVLLVIDLDGFKRVNDSLGHHAGDELLRQVARRILGRLQAGDTLSRMGGDEFTVVMPAFRDPSDAVRIGTELLKTLEGAFWVDERELFVTCSAGLAVYPEDGHDAATLQRHADVAMYRAKTAGKDTLRCFAPEMNETAQERLELEGGLRRALALGELELHYQPQVTLSGRPVAVEALVRWRHPILGLVLPEKFIPTAEESGLIVAIGGWVLTEACRQAAVWRDAGWPIRVAVNVSALQFARPDFFDTVEQAIKDAGLDPSLLEVELTESLVMRDPKDSARQMERLRALGVRVAVDDFGTGYSSLSYLHWLPIDVLKIDRSFVAGLGAPRNTQALVQAIVALARALGLTVVAEGVETTAQLAFLSELGCDLAQGYLFTKPMPAKEASAFLAVHDLGAA
ncbi:EAL domain-containing protein [Deinococcus sp. QL22]|uniref:EAL domain-containing protein n=1 Tax=Deinococcus sp. QL22 TaxID=2939437 RepID=UPI002016DD21|nr:EAL domain-containing protein [Deinococcus sp. QL22]UQN10098.1 EAL domain-containing protein [Deinococcus sp. QL22]